MIICAYIMQKWTDLEMKMSREGANETRRAEMSHEASTEMHRAVTTREVNDEKNHGAQDQHREMQVKSAHRFRDDQQDKAAHISLTRLEAMRSEEAKHQGQREEWPRGTRQ